MIKFIIVGASGSGKTTIANMLEKTLSLKKCVTHTTRKRRKREPKSAYHFVSKDKFEKIPMLESVCFGGEYYGSSKEEIEKADFIILEPKGVEFFKAKMPWLKVIKVERIVEPQPSSPLEARKKRDNKIFDDVQYDFLINKKSRNAVKKEALLIVGKIIEATEGSNPSLFAEKENCLD